MPSNGWERLELQPVCVASATVNPAPMRTAATKRVMKADFSSSGPSNRWESQIPSIAHRHRKARQGKANMLKIKKIDHVAICVPDTDEAIAKYEQLFGLKPELREVVASQQTEATLLPIGETSLELISPKGNDGL